MVELSRRKLAKQSSEKELEEFVCLLMSAKAMPPRSKPSISSWMVEDKVKRKIQCLEAYALDMLESDEQRKTAGNVIFTCLVVLTFFYFVFLFLVIDCNCFLSTFCDMIVNIQDLPQGAWIIVNIHDLPQGAWIPPTIVIMVY